MARLKKGLLLAEYYVKGENLRYLPELLHRKGADVHYFNEISKTECHIEIDFIDSYKFFAICKNMCYNKKIIKYSGLLAPLTFFIKKVGYLVGAVLFLVITAIANNLVLDVKVIGSGSCFESQTKDIIYSQGVSKYSFFWDIDYKSLEREILVKSPRLSFVSVKKKGNVLVIDTALSSSEPEVLGKNACDLISSCDGVVEEITVLRGTALVSTGQRVKQGDVLVGAYLLGKDDSVYDTFVIARVKILKKSEYFYKCNGASEKDVSIAYALAEFNSSGEIKDKSHEIVDGGVKVTLTVRVTVYGG